MQRTAVINVVGLTGALIGHHTPHIRDFASKRSIVPDRTRLSSSHLHCAIHLPDRRHAPRARNRRERWFNRELVRGPVLETVQSPCGRAGKLWEELREREPELHLRKTVLVVQHVFQRGLHDHAAPHVSGRRTQDFRYLHAARDHASTNQKEIWADFLFAAFLGSGRRA